MTTSIDNRIDELISRVRNHGAIAQFSFIPAFPANKTPNPVKKYTVTAENLSLIEKEDFLGDRAGYRKTGRIYEVKLRLRVYAPERSSGSALLRASSMLAEALDAEDSERLISGISFSDIGFDTASRTEFRDVFAELNILVTREAAV